MPSDVFNKLWRIAEIMEIGFRRERMNKSPIANLDDFDKAVEETF